MDQNDHLKNMGAKMNQISKYGDQNKPKLT